MTWRPAIAAGARKVLLARLIANGLLQTALALGLAALMAQMLTALGTDGTSTAIWKIALALILLGVGSAALRTWQRRDAEAFGLSYVQELRLNIFKRLCEVPTGEIRLGAAMTRFTADLGSVKNWISHGVAGVAVAVAALVTGAGALTFIDWRMALATVTPLLFCVAVAITVSFPLRKTVRESRRLRGRLAGRIGDGLMGRSSLLHLGLIDRELTRLAEASTKLEGALVRRAFWAGILRFSIEAVTPIAAAILLMLHLLSVDSTPLSATSVASWLFGLSVVLAPVRDAARAWDYRLVFQEAMARLAHLWASEPPEHQRSAAITPTGMQAGELHLSGLQLPGSDSSLDLTADGGSLVAVTGDRSARTDLFLAIARLVPTRNGAILFNGVPIEAISHRDFSRTIGLVSAAVPLLRGSVRRNLLRGSETAPADAVEAVLRLCRLDDEASLPAGLDTRVNAALPNPIRSRVALARALVRTPSVLLVDDELLLSHCEGRAAIQDLIANRSCTLIVAIDDPDLLEVPDLVWTLAAERRTYGDKNAYTLDAADE